MRQKENIAPQNYKIENVIGQGQFAQVRVCRDTSTGQRFAMKMYNKSKADYNNIKREINLLQQCQHPNIISLRDCYEDEKSVRTNLNTFQVNIILDYVSSMSLAEFIKNRVLNDVQIKTIFTQLISAIAYLHSLNICHRDIKLENILYSQQIALIDFGFAIKTTKLCQTPCGTPSYMAPELISKQPYRPQATDIWACGVLLHQLIFHDFPKANKPQLSCSPIFVKLLKGCLEINPDKRFSAERILLELNSQ